MLVAKYPGASSGLNYWADYAIDIGLFCGTLQCIILRRTRAVIPMRKRPFLLSMLLGVAVVTDLLIVPPSNSQEIAEDQIRQSADWLQGVVYKTKPGVNMDSAAQGIATPGIWDGLPADTVYLGGSLLRFHGNVESSQKLGYSTLRIGGRYYLALEVISGSGSGLESRIVDAVMLPSGATLGPCSKHGQEDDNMFSVLNADEKRAVDRQRPSRMDDIKAFLDKPKNVFRFDPRRLRILSVDSAGITCKGFDF